MLISSTTLNGAVGNDSNNNITMSVGNTVIANVNSTGMYFEAGKKAIYTGGILQVVQSANSTTTTVSSASWVDTGYVGTITPTSTSSKILVIVNTMPRHQSAGMNPNYRLSRGGAAFSGAVSDFYHPTGGGVSGCVTITWLDSPATTSPVTYGLQWMTAGAGGSVIFNADYNNNNYGVTYITMMEIAG